MNLSMMPMITFSIIYAPLILQGILIAITFWLLLKIKLQAQAMMTQTNIIKEEFDSKHKAMIGPSSKLFRKNTFNHEVHIYNYGELTAHEVKFRSFISTSQHNKPTVENYDIDHMPKTILFPKQDMPFNVTFDFIFDPKNIKSKNFILFFTYKCTYFSDNNKKNIENLFGIIELTVSQIYDNYEIISHKIVDQWI